VISTEIFHVMDLKNVYFFFIIRVTSKWFNTLWLTRKNTLCLWEKQFSASLLWEKKKVKVPLEHLSFTRKLKYDRVGWGLCQSFLLCHLYGSLFNVVCICSLETEIFAAKFFRASLHTFYLIFLWLQLYWILTKSLLKTSIYNSSL